MTTLPKGSTYEEYLAGMQEYSKKIKKMSAEESKKALIRIGVLNANGKPKKQICTGANYGG